jgi:hypothetical protein
MLIGDLFDRTDLVKFELGIIKKYFAFSSLGAGIFVIELKILSKENSKLLQLMVCISIVEETVDSQPILVKISQGCQSPLIPNHFCRKSSKIL